MIIALKAYSTWLVLRCEQDYNSSTLFSRGNWATLLRYFCAHLNHGKTNLHHFARRVAGGVDVRQIHRHAHPHERTHVRVCYRGGAAVRKKKKTATWLGRKEHGNDGNNADGAGLAVYRCIYIYILPGHHVATTLHGLLRTHTTGYYGRRVAGYVHTDARFTRHLPTALYRVPRRSRRPGTNAWKRLSNKGRRSLRSRDLFLSLSLWLEGTRRVTPEATDARKSRKGSRTLAGR